MSESDGSAPKPQRPRFPELPPPLRIVAEIPAVQRARSLRIRAILVTIGVVFLPVLFVTAATGFDTPPGELLRLTIAVIPVAIIVGWWLGWRMVLPIEDLRRQVLARTVDTGDQDALDIRRTDEFGNLAAAFNALLVQLEERNRANVDFAADLAHEFKNPVAAIRAAAEALDRGAVDEKRARRLAGILQRSSGRLDRLVTQLLELARAEAGMTGENWGPVDVSELARGVVESAQLDERWSQVQFHFATDGPAIVYGVAGGLETAIRNLVLNAASFNTGAECGEPGSVSVRVEHIEAEHTDERVAIRVHDTGPGIAEKDLEHVFDRFFTTRGGSKKGTGLGLSLVKAVAAAHRGIASVRSRVGEWTEFRLELWMLRDGDSASDG